jgi:hypothetical protein
MTFIDRTNRRFAGSVFGRYFQLEFSGHPRERKGSRFFTEIRAGLATLVKPFETIFVLVSFEMNADTCPISFLKDFLLWRR